MAVTGTLGLTVSTANQLQICFTVLLLPSQGILRFPRSGLALQSRIDVGVFLSLQTYYKQAVTAHHEPHSLGAALAGFAAMSLDSYGHQFEEPYILASLARRTCAWPRTPTRGSAIASSA